MTSYVDLALKYGAVPAWLKQGKWWLLWEKVPKQNRKDGKIPYYVDGQRRSGKLDTPQDMARLGTFEQALSGLASDCRFAGLGVAQGPNGKGKYLQAIDFDDFAANPHLWDLAQEIPTYVEVSPSFNGLRSFGLGEYFAPLNSNKSGVESWSTGHFATVTGMAIKPDDGKGPICLSQFVADRLIPLHSSAKQVATSTVIEPIVPKKIVFAPGTGLLSDIESALSHISSDDRESWISVGEALVGFGEDGYRLWINWSEKSEKHQPDKDPAVWKSLKGERTTYESIFIRARANGWRDPMSRLVLTRNFIVPESSRPISPMAKAPVSLTQLDSTPTLKDIQLHDLVTNPPKPPDFVIEKILPRKAVTLLSGHGGSGKSMLALQTAVELTQGHSSLGSVVSPCRVLFYSAEDSADVIRERIARIINAKFLAVDRIVGKLLALDATNEGPLYSEISEGRLRKGSTTQSYDRLVERVEAFKPDLIIIDNASDAYDANENERSKVREFLRALGRIAVQFNAAVLLLAHVDKFTARNPASNQPFSGSTAWHNSSRSRLYLEVDESGIAKLVHQKSNHGRLAKTVALQWDKNGLLEPLPAQDEGALLATLLALIRENYMREVFIQPSASGKNTAHGILRLDERFPRTLDAKTTHRLLESALRVGRLKIEKYKDRYRHDRQRYQVESPALSPITPDSARSTV